MKNEEPEANDSTQPNDEYIDELNELVSQQIATILQFASMKREAQEDPQDPFEAVYEAMAESIATDVVLFSALKHLEERLGNAPQDT